MGRFELCRCPPRFALFAQISGLFSPVLGLFSLILGLFSPILGAS